MKLLTRFIPLIAFALEITALLVISTNEFNLGQLAIMLLMALPYVLLGAYTFKVTPLRSVHIVRLATAILIAGVGVLVFAALILFRENWDIVDPLLIVLLLLPIPQTLTVMGGGIAGYVLRRRAENNTA